MRQIHREALRELMRRPRWMPRRWHLAGGLADDEESGTNWLDILQTGLEQVGGIVVAQQGGQTRRIVQPSGSVQTVTTGARAIQAQTNLTPWLLAGGAAVLGLLLLSRRK